MVIPEAPWRPADHTEASALILTTEQKNLLSHPILVTDKCYRMCSFQPYVQNHCLSSWSTYLLAAVYKP